ncbi:hypothetical protein ACFVXG_03510 [Kitasatospora sp. NPDC058162]|uniref:hypothetical protein n=1 Tax=Kitasatospora sp. NPDC058162 TaxID=3346362 RepID=UPI0036D8A80D
MSDRSPAERIRCLNAFQGGAHEERVDDGAQGGDTGWSVSSDAPLLSTVAGPRPKVGRRELI